MYPSDEPKLDRVTFRMDRRDQERFLIGFNRWKASRYRTSTVTAYLLHLIAQEAERLSDVDRRQTEDLRQTPARAGVRHSAGRRTAAKGV